jgi:squalene-hopene/tetraprenyl-beta-curcumene cyclase
MSLAAGEPGAGRAGQARQEALRQRLARAVAAAQGRLLAAQHADGHWCGELEGDTILETEYVLLLHFLGRLDDPRVGRAARYVRRRQLPAGGWAIYPGGPPEVSASVKAYFVLKLAGDDPEAPHMRRARRTIHGLGGLDACNSFTKIYLAICGQYEWQRCPAVPPEMVLLPRWLYFNLYEMSSWSRAIVVPLSVLWALRPVRPVAAGLGIAELRLPRAAGAAEPRTGVSEPRIAAEPQIGAQEPRTGAPEPRTGAREPLPRALGGASRFWRAFFLLLDRGLWTGERLGLTPFRRRALARAEAWILERLEDSDGLGAIFPPIVNTIFALRCLGYDADHPAVAGQLRELERLEIEEDGELRLQPCFSAVWDTALALHALNDSGLDPGHPAIEAARGWLLAREIRRTGDWSVKAPGVPAGGWCFEYRNAFYPDCDDTAEVLTALSALPGGGEEPAARRGVVWLLGMQNDDGGWGAFDRACDKQILTHVPFADHNALLDPSTADVTGRALDALLRLGLAAGAPPLARAAAFLRGQQEKDGSWYGRWGCNYVYGTWLALRALARCDPPQEPSGEHRPSAVDEPRPRPARAATDLQEGPSAAAVGRGGDLAGEPWRRRAIAWLVSHQNPDGGWGESPRSYDEPDQKGIGPSTAAQTAWALMGLFAAGVVDDPAVERGVDFLLRAQREDGSWRDEPWTATGFPRVFYLRYHLYAVYFPLMALAECRQLRGEAELPHPQHAYPLAVPARAAAVSAPAGRRMPAGVPQQALPASVEGVVR